MAANKVKKSFTYGIKSLPLILYSLTVVGTIYYLIITSLKSHSEYTLNKVGFPETITIVSYTEAITTTMFSRWFLNSVIITFLTILIGSCVSILMSFAFSRFKFRFRNTAYALVSSLMVVPPIVLIASIYQIWASLGLVNNYFGVIIIYIGWMIPFWTYFLAKSFSTMENGIVDSAIIDGCSNFKLLTKIFIPLSKAPIITLTLASTLWIWSDLLIPLIFFQTDSMKTLMAGLSQFKGIYSINIPVIFSGLVIATIPMIIFYAFGQRFFEKGVMAGSVKG